MRVAATNIQFTADSGDGVTVCRAPLHWDSYHHRFDQNLWETPYSVVITAFLREHSILMGQITPIFELGLHLDLR